MSLLIALLAFPLVGLLIAARRRTSPIGWLLLAIGLGWLVATKMITVWYILAAGVTLGISTAFEMLPLVVLYLASIVMLKIADRRAAARAATESSSSLPEGLDPT